MRPVRRRGEGLLKFLAQAGERQTSVKARNAPQYLVRIWSVVVALGDSINNLYIG